VDPARFRDPAAKNLEEYREIVEERFPFARWYFGHYHQNVAIQPASRRTKLIYTCLYGNVESITKIVGTAAKITKQFAFGKPVEGF
jgi:hypothetical protein